MRRRRLWPFGVCLLALLLGGAMADTAFAFCWILCWLILTIPAYKLTGYK